MFILYGSPKSLNKDVVYGSAFSSILSLIPLSNTVAVNSAAVNCDPDLYLIILRYSEFVLYYSALTGTQVASIVLDISQQYKAAVHIYNGHQVQVTMQHRDISVSVAHT
ncbi:MAG: hypothetical protein IPO98_07435 [Saprospiraceae bacterium]|nr:hypothetical protein [Saprospiraceae bacterium]